MKQYLFLFATIILCFSCKTNKVAFGTAVIAKKMPVKKVIRKYHNASFHEKSLEANLKISYKDTKNSQSVRVKMRILKDQVIWLNATYAGFVVARAKITPTSIQYYEKLHKTYFDGNFVLLKNLLGTEISFTQLQNLLLGQAIVNLKAQKYTVTIDGNAHLLSPETQNSLTTMLFWINPGHFKLDKQEIRNPIKNQLLEIDYSNYALIENEVFPKKIIIKGTQNNQLTTIKIDFKSVVFNKDFSTSFHIPNGYKSLKFNE